MRGFFKKEDDQEGKVGGCSDGSGGKMLAHQREHLSFHLLDPRETFQGLYNLSMRNSDLEYLFTL